MKYTFSPATDFEKLAAAIAGLYGSAAGRQRGHGGDHVQVDAAGQDPAVLVVGVVAPDLRAAGGGGGLLDQMGASVGGMVTIDFADNDHPVVEKVDFDFAAAGHALFRAHLQIPQLHHIQGEALALDADDVLAVGGHGQTQEEVL